MYFHNVRPALPAPSRPVLASSYDIATVHYGTRTAAPTAPDLGQIPLPIRPDPPPPLEPPQPPPQHPLPPPPPPPTHAAAVAAATSSVLLAPPQSAASPVRDLSIRLPTPPRDTAAGPPLAWPPPALAPTAAGGGGGDVEERVRSECAETVAALSRHLEEAHARNEALEAQNKRLLQDREDVLHDAEAARTQRPEYLEAKAAAQLHHAETAVQEASMERLVEGLIERDRVIAAKDRAAVELEARLTALKEAHCSKVLALEEKVRVFQERSSSALHMQLAASKDRIAALQEKLSQKTKELADAVVYAREMEGRLHAFDENKEVAALRAALRVAERAAETLAEQSMAIGAERDAAMAECAARKQTEESLLAQLEDEAAVASKYRRVSLLEGSKTDAFPLLQPRIDALFHRFAALQYQAPEQAAPLVRRDGGRGGGLRVFLPPTLLHDVVLADLWEAGGEEAAVDAEQWRGFFERVHRRSPRSAGALLRHLEDAALPDAAASRVAALHALFADGLTSFARQRFVDALRLPPQAAEALCADLTDACHDSGEAVAAAASPAQQVTLCDFLAYFEKAHQRNPASVDTLLHFLEAVHPSCSGAAGLSPQAPDELAAENRRLADAVKEQNAVILGLTLDLRAQGWSSAAAAPPAPGPHTSPPRHHSPSSAHAGAAAAAKPLPVDTEEGVLSLYVSVASVLRRDEGGRVFGGGGGGESPDVHTFLGVLLGGDDLLGLKYPLFAQLVEACSGASAAVTLQKFSAWHRRLRGVGDPVAERAADELLVWLQKRCDAAAALQTWLATDARGAFPEEGGTPAQVAALLGRPGVAAALFPPATSDAAASDGDAATVSLGRFLAWCCRQENPTQLLAALGR
eukprot:Rhum_TRINITY_DN10410_c0_g1::Rhum_TRINITY_DN10410_c0_g1_i1::g.38344::m.38344